MTRALLTIALAVLVVVMFMAAVLVNTARADELDKAREYASWVHPGVEPPVFTWMYREDVLEHRFDPETTTAFWFPDTGRIFLHRPVWAQMTRADRCRTIGHELWHTRYGPTHSANPRSIGYHETTSHPYRPCDRGLAAENRRASARRAKQSDWKVF